jgi:hypothetical protein
VWYDRLHTLYATNPVVDRTAVAHSGSDLDLTCLAVGQQTGDEVHVRNL